MATPLLNIHILIGTIELPSQISQESAWARLHLRFKTEQFHARQCFPYGKAQKSCVYSNSVFEFPIGNAKTCKKNCRLKTKKLPRP